MHFAYRLQRKNLGKIDANTEVAEAVKMDKKEELDLENISCEPLHEEMKRTAAELTKMTGLF